MSPALRTVLRRLRHLGWARHCVVCGAWLRHFLPHGVVRRENAVCPVCQSRERHRLAWLWFRHEAGLLHGQHRFLHVAPEAALARHLRALPNLTYVSGDLFHAADLRMDVTRLPFRDAAFDVIYCSHVLNMLPDDAPAMAELHRVCAPGGYVLLQIPQPDDAQAVEVPAQCGREDRLQALGDPDMYRRYGRRMLLDRLVGAGFVTEVVAYFSRFAASRQQRIGLIDEDLFVCRKP